MRGGINSRVMQCDAFTLHPQCKDVIVSLSFDRTPACKCTYTGLISELVRTGGHQTNTKQPASRNIIEMTANANYLL